MTIELNFKPKPVSVTTPTIIPAPAQVAATFKTPTEPPSMAFIKGDFKSNDQNDPLPWNKSYEIKAQSRRKKLLKNDTTVAQKTESTGEKPHIMKKMIETSDKKWKP